jgi:hypothetical protein
VGAETANTYATLFDSTTTNWAGDTVDSNVPLITGLPITLVETGKTVQDPSTPTPRTIRQITAIVPEYAHVTSDFRLMDEATGDVYIVLAVTRPPTIIGAPTDRVLDLKRISGTGT